MTELRERIASIVGTYQCGLVPYCEALKLTDQILALENNELDALKYELNQLKQQFEAIKKEGVIQTKHMAKMVELDEDQSLPQPCNPLYPSMLQVAFDSGQTVMFNSGFRKIKTGVLK